MEIRVLRYFLAIAREESFSRAAEVLHLTQPTLSRQIRDLEEELGVTLFDRSGHAVLLTHDGLRLRKRAQELVDLMDRTADEFAAPPDELAGEVFIGCGEAYGMRRIARLAADANHDHPGLRFHLHSGNTEDVLERLDRGLADFGVLIEPFNPARYDSITLPEEEQWGLLLRTDHPLAQKEAVTQADLHTVPLLVSGDERQSNRVLQSMGLDPEQLTVVGTYNLLYNAALMVREGLGCALALDRLADTSSSSELTFRPLHPKRTAPLSVVWKKYPVFSPAAEYFHRRLLDSFTTLP